MDELRWSLLILGVLVVGGILAREFLRGWLARLTPLWRRPGWRLPAWPGAGWRRPRARRTGGARSGTPPVGRGLRDLAPATRMAVDLDDPAAQAPHGAPARSRAPNVAPTDAPGPSLGDLERLDEVTLEAPARRRRPGGTVTRATDPGQAELPFDAAEDASPGPPPASAELIVALHVMHAQREPLDGPALHAALQDLGLRYGAMRIFHHPGLAPAPGGATVFSVARAVEPGSFDLDDAASFATPGVVFFMRLPGAEDGAVTFELMLSSAETLARQLGADLLDDRRSVLTAQAVSHLRETVAEFERRGREGTRRAVREGR